MKLLRLSSAATIVGLFMALLPAAAVAEDVFFHVPLSELTITSGVLPTNLSSQLPMIAADPRMPYAVFEGDTEAYITGFENVMPGRMAGKGVSSPISLAIRGPKDKEVAGRLFMPKDEGAGMAIIAFKVKQPTVQADGKESFYGAKEKYYSILLDHDIPGAAWFRHQRDAAKALADTKTNAHTDDAMDMFLRPHHSTEEDTYNLFSGGRAVSENLQLDRSLFATSAGDMSVDISTLTGITVREMDWKPLIKDLKPETDPLAASVPADQHAIFFRSFQAMTQLMDEADSNGTPLLQMFEPRSEDRDSRGRYQRQLCLGLSEISRLLGPTVVDSVAFTGSDPYLRTGTDIGVLFEAKSPDALKTFITARQAAAQQQAGSEAKPVSGEVEGVAYSGVASPDRSICSYIAVRSNVVFVSNSQKQLTRMLAAAKGTAPALVSQPEYTYFRSRYARSDKQESALLVLSDATIRRWCSPQWRIGASRRTRAAALMADQQAAHFERLAKGTVQAGPIMLSSPPADIGELSMTTRGVRSSAYGSLDFLTPIVELSMPKVTQSEADNYQRWRDTYQENWNHYFDPIAARFSLSSNRIGVELTVTPLIARSEYAEVISVSQGAAIAPGAGDPHPGTLAHLAVAINAESEPVKQAANFLGSITPAFKVNALGWLGQCVAVYADEDPFWERLAAADDRDQFMEKNYTNVPAALWCEVKNPLGLTAFLTALRAFSDQSAPGILTWSNLDYKGQAYVCVKSKSEDPGISPAQAIAVYYAVTPKSLFVTLSEPLLKRALDRQAARAGDKAMTNIQPWLGTNLCLQLDGRFIKVLQALARDEGADDASTLSWNNLPILNEWKRRFPAQDPVKLHEEFWGTRLVCPGGGTYVWNEKWQTMESTVYGHPGEPKAGPPSLGPWVNIVNANLGVTFENMGLSAKAVLTRAAAKP